MQKYTCVQIYVNKYVNQNVSQGCEAGRWGGTSSTRTGGGCSSCIQKTLRSSLLRSLNVTFFHYPPFSVYNPIEAFLRDGEGLRGLLERLKRHLAFRLVSGWVAGYWLSPACNFNGAQKMWLLRAICLCSQIQVYRGSKAYPSWAQCWTMKGAEHKLKETHPIMVYENFSSLKCWAANEIDKSTVRHAEPSDRLLVQT